MKASIFLLISLLSVFLFSCSQQKSPEFDTAAVKAAIDSANSNFSSSFSKGDAHAMASFYTDSATVLPPNMDTVSGRNSIEKFWYGYIKMGNGDIKLTTSDLFGSGNLAVETGVYNLNIQPQGMELIQDHGKYLVVWQKQGDGSWKMIRDMWSSNIPHPLPQQNKKGT
jgi:ketosteroid isomerase-like protein